MVKQQGSGTCRALVEGQNVFQSASPEFENRLRTWSQETAYAKIVDRGSYQASE